MFSPPWCAAPVLSNDRQALSTTLNKNNKSYKDEKNKIKYKKYDKMRWNIRKGKKIELMRNFWKKYVGWKNIFFLNST